jgi:predicted Zn finger-like uncharacterized protein
MIVKCERCQTRFKIPDEKVTEKGVKVRCTKCQHTFRVAREDAVSATPAPADPAPSAKPPAATPRTGTPLEVPRTSAPGKAPAASGPGVAAPRGGAPALPLGLPREAPRTPATIDLDPLMEFIGENTPQPADALKLAAKAPLPNKPAGALAAGQVQPQQLPTPVPARSAPPAPKPAASVAPVQVPAKSPAPAPVSSAPFSFDENDPFGASEEPAPTVPATPTLPPRPVPTPVPVRSAPPAPKPAPVPVQVPARSPAPRASAPVAVEKNDPFALPPDDAPTVPATPTLPPRGAAPAPMALEENDPFALPPDDAPGSGPAFEEMEGLEGNNPFVSFQVAPTVPATPTLPPAPAPRPAPARSPAPAPAAAPAPAFEEMEGLDGNNPFAAFDPVAALPSSPGMAAVPAAAPETDNPFAAFDPVAALPSSPGMAAVPAPSPAPAPSGIPDWGAPQGAVPAGMPDWGAPQQPPPAGMPDWGATQTVPATPTAKANAPTERNAFTDFPDAGAPSTEILPDLPAAAPAPPVIAPPTVKQAEAPKERTGPRLVQRLAAVAAQLVVAAVLVVGLAAVGSAWLNGGRVELSALSPSRMRELVSPTRPLMAKDLSNGLYETADGHALFFVRGEVENRGTAPVRVKATVALFDGEQRVKSAEGLAGTVPSPEELYLLKGAREAEALRGRLDGAVKDVAPGARAPFVVFFYDYPSDLAGFRLEVTLEPHGATAAAGGAKEAPAGNAQP